MRFMLGLFFVLSVVCFGGPASVREQATCLREILREADDAYYNREDPIMGNQAYDALREQYERLIALHPERGLEAQVGAPVSAEAKKEKHVLPVLSLKKAYTDSEVVHFLEGSASNTLYCIEPKIDGVSLIVRYQDGFLVKAMTRGDGHTGCDVTSAVLVSGALPVRLNAEASFEMRGELYLPKRAFEVLNQRRLEEGKAVLRSARNTAAGTLRLKKVAEIARRGLTFSAFELRESDEMPATHADALRMLEAWGISVVPHRVVDGASVLDAIEALQVRRVDFPYLTDGMVVRVNDRAAYQALGCTKHHPRGALARKYPEMPVETRLVQMEWRVGERGRVIPIACFEPVELNGAVVQRANLHSIAHFRALDLREGDWIEVVRAGGAVPEVIRVDTARRSGMEKIIEVPSGL